jgi:hypothetical protein
LNPDAVIRAVISSCRKPRSPTRYLDGLSIVVEVPEAGSLNIGTPVLFRGIEVGTVTGLTLGSLSDRDGCHAHQPALSASGAQQLGVLAGIRLQPRLWPDWRRGENRYLQSVHSRRYRLCHAAGHAAGAESAGGKHFLLLESEPKEWREWGTPCRVNLSTAPCLAPEPLCYTAHLFFCRWYQVAYFPDNSAQMREAMPSTLSFDFIAACQRPLLRSIRVNTLKITVADFLTPRLQLAAHAGSLVCRRFLDRAR